MAKPKVFPRFFGMLFTRRFKFFWVNNIFDPYSIHYISI